MENLELELELAIPYGGPQAIAPKSWIELRYVKRNGKVYGPYRVRRWRSGGRLRSRYLGKVKND